MDIIMDQEGKLPEGVTIDKPISNKQERPRGFPIPDFVADPSLPRIIFPHYIDNKRSMLAATLLRPDGSAATESGIPKDPNHPLCADIFAQYTEEEILHNTQRQIQMHASAEKAAGEMEKDQKQNATREALWEAKQAYLAMDIMSIPENKEFRRQVRKSETKLEADAFGIAAVLRAYELNSK
jgi:hypothetical protein